MTLPKNVLIFDVSPQQTLNLGRQVNCWRGAGSNSQRMCKPPPAAAQICRADPAARTNLSDGFCSPARFSAAAALLASNGPSS
jgi:hypothetical protein